MGSVAGTTVRGVKARKVRKATWVEVEMQVANPVRATRTMRKPRGQT